MQTKALKKSARLSKCFNQLDLGQKYKFLLKEWRHFYISIENSRLSCNNDFFFFFLDFKRFLRMPKEEDEVNTHFKKYQYIYPLCHRYLLLFAWLDARLLIEVLGSASAIRIPVCLYILISNNNLNIFILHYFYRFDLQNGFEIFFDLFTQNKYIYVAQRGIKKHVMQCHVIQVDTLQ